MIAGLLLQGLLYSSDVSAAEHGVLQSNPPDPAKLRMDDIMGITVILLTCSYNDKARRNSELGTDHSLLLTGYVAAV